MKVTKQGVKIYLSRWFEVDTIEQIGNKQLFVVYLKNGTELLVSYCTVIGISYNDMFMLTRYKYSPTTSKQVSQFRVKHDCVSIPHDDFKALLSEVLELDNYSTNRLTSI